MKRVISSSRSRGLLGEAHAVAFLERAGYRIAARNFRTQRGEIDIIAWDGGTLVFAEVKAWTAFTMDDLAVSISRRKQRRIIDAARFYMMKEGLTDRVPVRFDLIFIEGDSMQVHHVREAFAESTWSG